ncbi:AraC family transcriptional regulator [Paenibacillus aurantiacus]|uniref:AraC family transcriptional regulator n=1 Tax=Paenibacillus aurantiacus TaxID=1936118 RepID=A0ABV5KRI5_9BACL
MQPVRKPFHLEPNFPFELVYKGVRHVEDEWPDHLHDLYEVVYIHEGRGTFFIDHALYDKRPGDLFLIPGNTVHRAFPSTDEPVVSTALFFSPALVQAVSLNDGFEPLRCFEVARQTKQYKIALPEPVRTRIEAAIHAMGNEITEQGSGYRRALWLQLEQLLLELDRHPFMQEAASSAIGIGPHWIQAALRDINSDPIRCGGLAELAIKACVSASHFSRVFKQLTGMNVTDYVNAKRLVRAKELLLSTDDTIETIALLCGFQGMRHFYDVFKKLTGVTPKMYRRQQQAK